MTIKFRDLYNALRNTENAYERMDVDMAAAMCGMPKCVLSTAQENLLESYMELANVDVDFCSLDFQAIIEKIDECFQCVTDEFAGLLPPALPEPEESVVGDCTGTLVVALEHIRRFRIYERTYTHSSIPSPIQVYVFNKDALPGTFEPSVPEQYSSHEKYYVSLNEQRNSLRIKVDHDTYPESMGAPSGSFNIAMVVAEIEEQYVDYYAKTEVKACMAMLMTPGVKWDVGYGLDKAVDGNPATYTSSTGTPSEIAVEFMFLV